MGKKFAPDHRLLVEGNFQGMLLNQKGNQNQNPDFLDFPDFQDFQDFPQLLKPKQRRVVDLQKDPPDLQVLQGH